MTRTGVCVALLLACASAPTLAIAAPRLERVVIVMRHGVRPPTKPAEALAPLADKPWPSDEVWGVKPGELTQHGALEIQKFGKDLRARYADERPGAAVIWADGADQRTRETARNLAMGLAPDAPPAFGAVADGTHDPLFSGPGADVCPPDPGAVEASIKGLGPIVTPETADGLKVLQRIASPNGCSGGGGPCLSGETTLGVTAKGAPKLDGPLATGAAISENLLLEYENGLPAEQVGWGRMSRADLDAAMATHRRVSDLERASPTIAARRGSTMGRFILAALSEDAVAVPGGPQLKASDRMVVLAGHDTNLANMGGVFALSWAFPDQPDVTAPGTAIAFERWRDDDGKRFVRVRIFYTTPDQVRTRWLRDTPAHEMYAGGARGSGRLRGAGAGADRACRRVRAKRRNNQKQDATSPRSAGGQRTHTVVLGARL